MFTKIRKIIDDKKRKKEADKEATRRHMFIARLENYKKNYLNSKSNKSADFYHLICRPETSYRRLIKECKITSEEMKEICNLLGVDIEEWTNIGVKGYAWLFKVRIKEGYIFPFVVMGIIIYLWVYICLASLTNKDYALLKVSLRLIILLLFYLLTTKESLWGRDLYDATFSPKTRKRLWALTTLLILIYGAIDLGELFL